MFFVSKIEYSHLRQKKDKFWQLIAAFHNLANSKSAFI